MIDISVSCQEVQVNLLSKKLKLTTKIPQTSITGFLSMNISFRVRILSSRFSMVTWTITNQTNPNPCRSRFTLLAPPEVIALVNSETSWSNLFQQTHRVSALAWDQVVKFRSSGL